MLLISLRVMCTALMYVNVRIYTHIYAGSAKLLAADCHVDKQDGMKDQVEERCMVVLEV